MIAAYFAVAAMLGAAGFLRLHKEGVISRMALYILCALYGMGLGMWAHASPPLDNLRSTAVRIENGSGSVVEGASGRRYILSNYHVCLGAAWKGTLTAFHPTGETITGRIVKRAPAVDLCAARLKGHMPALKLGRQAAPMQEVWTRGYPAGILSETHGRLATGTTWRFFFPIEEVGECPDEYRKEYGYDGRLSGCVATFSSTLSSLYSRPGSSGSPVVDRDGDLVGVISSFDPRGNFNAGLVPFDDLKSFMEGL